MIEALEGNFAGGGEVGAAVAVWGESGRVLAVARGRRSRGEAAGDWERETLVPVWSTGKGPAATALLLALEEAGLGLETPVRRVWPELGVEVDFGQLLSHQAGLAALRAEVPVWEREAVVAALERQEPWWEPGLAHGYHARTSGYLWDECVRRLTGAPLADYWSRRVAEPLGVDVFFGVPEAELGRVAQVEAGRASARPEEADFVREYGRAGSLTRLAFATPRGLQGVAEMNSARALRAGFAAFGAVASADGLAAFYAALAAGAEPLGGRILRWAREVRCSGPDRVLQMPTAYTGGFQRDPLLAGGEKARRSFGRSVERFGHPGAGGSLAFADPECRLGFAYVRNLIDPGVMPGPGARRLVAVLDGG